MEWLNEKTFEELIIKEYEDWCGYYGEKYLTEDDDEEELFEFVISNVKIDNSFTIEQLDDESFNAWKKFFKKINKDKIWDIVYEYNHPWSDWDNCDADFYGV